MRLLEVNGSEPSGVMVSQVLSRLQDKKRAAAAAGGCVARIINRNVAMWTVRARALVLFQA
eukprot:COSAG05_NODE_333_length_11249_cov_629.633094_8_plen_61_part_00